MKKNYLLERCKDYSLHLKTLFVLLMLLITIAGATATIDDAYFYYSVDDVDVNASHVFDVSGNARNGTLLNGATTGVTGIINQGVDVDGGTQMIAITDLNIDTELDTDFSVVYWYNADALSDNDRHVGFGSERYLFIWYESAIPGIRAQWKDTGDSWHTIDVPTSATGGWYMITLIRNATHYGIYFNDTEIDVEVSAVNIKAETETDSGFGTYSNDGLDGKLDEIGFWTRTLTPSEITSLFNSGSGRNPYDTLPDSGSVDVWITNSTDNITDNLTSGESFEVFVNWTNSSDTAIGNDTGYCEIEIESGINETAGSDDNFTVCGSPLCDFNPSFIEDFNDNDVVDLAHVDAHADFCYPNTQGDENVTFAVQCSSGTTSFQIAPSQIPLCSDGSLFFIAEGDGTCNGDANITINITSSDGHLDRVRVTDLEMDLVYTSLTHNMTYDNTSTLWYLTHSHEYYETGSYDLNVTCTDTVDNNLTASGTEVVNVFGGVPVIFFNEVVTDCGTTTMTDGFNLEYCDGIFMWYGSVVDNDAVHLIVRWYNSSEDILHSEAGSPLTTVMDTPDELFLDIDTSGYVLYVWVNDSEGNVAQENLTFFINDTIAPSVSILSPTNASNLYGQSNFIFQGRCTDQALYRFNYSITDITSGASFGSYEKTGIEDTLWFNQSVINITGLTTSVNDTDWQLMINLTCADAHTSNDLKILRHPSISSRTFSFTDSTVGFLEIEVRTAGAESFEFELVGDRYVFGYDTTIPTDEIEYTIRADSIDWIENSQFPSHLILNGLFWFDGLEAGSDIVDVVVSVDPDGEEAEVTIYLSESKTEFLTESLGEVNSFSEVFYLSNYDSTADTADFSGAGITCGEKYPDNTFDLDFNSTGWTNCTLKIDDFLYEGWSSDCKNITVETGIGRHNMVLTGTSALNNSVSSECMFWNDKLDKSVGDFMWIIMMIGTILAMVAMGFVYGIFMVFAGFFTIFLAFTLFAYSWVLALMVMVLAVVLILWEVMFK